MPGRGVSGIAGIAMQDTVLVVEDEPDVVDLLRYNLGKAGFQVLIAMAGDHGLDLARKMRPDIIVLDLMLPGMTGQEVCRALKTDASTEGIPIVTPTASSSPTSSPSYGTSTMLRNFLRSSDFTRQRST